jgi:heme-degrading monooxygenase HmoA
MYGTVARMRAKPGMEQQLRDMMLQEMGRSIPGYKTTYVFQMDAAPNTYMIAVVFESREAYVANANSPEQDAEYRKMLDLLEGPPEWNDGQIVYPEG